MKIHRRLITLVGLGMLLIIAITVFSLQSITTVFTSASKNVRMTSLKVQRMWTIEKNIDAMVLAVHDFVGSGRPGDRDAYQAARSSVQAALDELAAMQLTEQDMKVLASVMDDFRALEKKARRIFALPEPQGAQQVVARNLIIEMNGLVEWLAKDIEQYKKESGRAMDELSVLIGRTNARINAILALILITSVGFLFGFGLYMYRNVTVPLGALWNGAEAISRGDLDHRMEVRGQGDIVRLGERFNEMANKLKNSYADLERKLLDRTNELAALNSVALALGHAGSLTDVLQRSLEKVLESLSGFEPRGGVFLCEPEGNRLRLVAYRGLSPEFVERERTIAMGECLCGSVAETGELLYTKEGCRDPRHLHSGAGDAHSHIIIPIKSRGIVLGVMFLYPDREYELKSSDIHLLDTVGAELGIAVENLRLYSEVKESSEKYWDLFENSRDMLCIVDIDGRFLVVNKAVERFLDHANVDLVDKDVGMFLSPADADLVKRALRGEPLVDRQPLEFEITRKDGSRAFVEVIARKIADKHTPAAYQVAARDVTERRTLREMLVSAERLAAIGQVGIAVRHEINNPLTTVIGNTELLLERYDGDDSELAVRLRVVLDNALRIAEIVKRLEEIKKETTVEYTRGVKMTNLKKG